MKMLTGKGDKENNNKQQLSEKAVAYKSVQRAYAIQAIARVGFIPVMVISMYVNIMYGLGFPMNYALIVGYVALLIFLWLNARSKKQRVLQLLR